MTAPVRELNAKADLHFYREPVSKIFVNSIKFA